MATIEYEKKYKEALGWMQSLYPTMTGADKEDAEHFFPELKESEDERIRKEIIELVMQPTWKTEKEFRRRNELCVWLEKQQKPTWTQEDEMMLFSVIWHLRDSVNNGDQSNSAGGLESWIRTLKERVLSQPKQSEQKSVDKIEPKFKVGNKIKLAIDPKYPAKEIIAIQNGAYYFDEVVYLPFNRQDEWELVEQKSAWSEEDELKRSTLIHVVKKQQGSAIFEGLLPEELIDWLKSLKDRYTWKPTDAQMASITCAVRKMKESACYDSELVSLFNDLKKLREE